MQTPKNIAISCAALLIAACGNGGPVAKDADKSGVLAAPATSNSSDPSGAAPPPNAPTQPTPGAAPAAGGAAIPAIFHGRWGLAPDDCTSTRGDAKGLLVITSDALRFYESRGVPAGNVETTPDSISADFAFTGEGMTWSKFQSLEVQDGKLVRTESTPMASYTYARCD